MARRHRLAPLCGVLLGFAAATAAAAYDAPRITFEKYELPNGLDVILHEDHSIPVVSVNVWYHVGSGNEKPGRSGFAHLFEHMMFQGSENHPGEYFEPLQKVGAFVNGSTNTDRTNYVQDVPANYLELVLWLEADRMGFLLPAMDQAKFDNQRSVVKNERRQNYENQPYGKWLPTLVEMMYPAGHPYSWPTIGSQHDLDAASLADVTDFFKSYYTPNNAALVVAGDLDKARTKALIEKYFGSIPPGPAVERTTDWMPMLDRPVVTTTQDNVELPRVYFAWHTPGMLKPGDAEFDLLASVLSSGKTSRLYESLVYEREIAQDVNAFQWSREMGSLFVVQATARPGVPIEQVEQALGAEMEALLAKGITDQELTHARTGWQTSFVRRMELVGGFGGIANQLNHYNRYLGTPDGFQPDFDRYQSATTKGVLEYARRHLASERRGTLRIVPVGKLEVAQSDVDRKREPSGGDEPSFTPPRIVRQELPNGLAVLVVEDHSLPLVQANLVLRSGFAADPAGLPGVASLTAELLDEGTKNRDALQLDLEKKRLGASLSTSSGFDGSQVNLNVLASNLDKSLALMADVVLNPAFPAEELERQRRIYKGRIAQEAKEPGTAATKIFQRVLYGDRHPYATPYTGTGTPESLDKIQRDDLAAYYRNNYKPNNAALVFVGDVTPAAAQQLAARHFGAWPSGEVVAASVPEVAHPTTTQIHIVDKPGAAQSMILVGGVGARRSDPDFRAIEIMNNALGGKFTSRINLNLREDKGYSYGARSSFLAFRGVGPWFVSAPVQTQSTREAVVEILKELRDITGARPVTETEVVEAKGNMIKGFPRQFQSVGAIAAQVAEIVQYDLPLDEWQRSVQELATITPKQATEAARKHVDPEALVIVVVGDQAQIEAGLRALDVGEVKYLTAGR
jgi:zinc protease